jgi:uroporphyrinogen decarboxylase
MSDWSKRLRLEAVIAGAEVDRLPVALWRHWPGDDQDPEALAAAHLKWQADYDWDFVKVSPSSSYCLVDWGVRDEWRGHPEGTREYTGRAVQQPSDWQQLLPLDPYQGMLGAQLECLRVLGRELGETTPFIATIFSPLAQAKNLAGEERMLSHLRRYPDELGQGLATIADATIAFIEAARETGIAGIYYAVQHARFALMGPGEYLRFGRPFDERILSAAADLWLNVLHIHGEGVMFDLAADYGVPLINWHDRESGVSLAEGLSQFRGAASGGVSRETLWRDTPEPALEEARDAVLQTDGRRLVLGAGCVVMTNTPTRNIRLLRELADDALALL